MNLVSRFHFAALLALAASMPAQRASALIVLHGDTLYEAPLDAEVVNHGAIIGEAAALLEFGRQTRVSGDGYFEHTLISGTFAPGNSPGVTTGANQAFGESSTLEIELGGPTPGHGAGYHDQVQDSATITLFGAPTLSVLPFGGYLPTIGQQFTVITWQSGLDGAFALQVDSYFTSQGISFTQLVNNPTGPGDLTLVAIAVPEVSAWAFAALVPLLTAASLFIRRLCAMLSSA